MIQAVLFGVIEKQHSLQPLKFRKLFSYRYRDGAPMYTLGEVSDSTYMTGSRAKLMGHSVDDSWQRIISIDVPILTYREKSYLDSIISSLGVNLRNAVRTRPPKRGS